MATTLIRISIYVTFYLQLFSVTTSKRYLTIKNSCTHPTWPAILSKPGSAELPETMSGFALQPGESKVVSMPPKWSGILWGRTLCSTSRQGKFLCVTGGSGSQTQPQIATQADFTPISRTDGEYMTYYVSLLKGYNLPLIVVPIGGAGKYCRATGCIADLNEQCPKQLRVMYGNETVGCNYHSGTTYSDYFERTCPRSHTSTSDKNSTFECLSLVDYEVTFCASKFPSTSPPTPRYETHNEGLDKEKPKPMEFILKYLGGPTLAAILLLSCTGGFKLGIEHRSKKSRVRLDLSLNASISARRVEEPISW